MVKKRYALIPERFYYISLLASLEVLLNNGKILDMVAHPKVSELGSSLLCDFNDGTVQNHELFSMDPQNLKIILYYHVEVTNEHTERKHK